jgi:hypothetical protein
MASPAEELAGIAEVELALAQAVLDNVTNDVSGALSSYPCPLAPS